MYDVVRCHVTSAASQVCSGEGFCDCGKCNCNVTSLGVPKSEVLVAGPACDCIVSDEQCKDGR